MPNKILLISNLYPPYQIGGYEIAAFDVAQGLKNRKFEVMILTSDYKYNSKSPKETGVSRKLKLTQNWKGEIANSQSEIEINNYQQTKSILNQRQPDVIYFWNQCFLGGGPIQAAVESGIPFLHHLMGNDIISYLKIPWWHKRRFSKLKGSLLPTTYLQSPKTLNNSIFISRSLQTDFRSFGIKPKHAKVIYPGIELNKIIGKTHYKLASNRVCLVYVGQIAAHKGISVLIQALKLIQDDIKQKVSLSIYGEGDSSQVLRLGRKLGVDLKLMGFTPREKLYSKLHEYDIGVFPSVWKEPFGIAQIEMMAAGLPIISSAQGGAGEAIQNQVTGLTFQNENPESLALVLIDLINHYDQTASNLGKKARLWTKANYSHQLAIRRICDMIVDVIDYN